MTYGFCVLKRKESVALEWVEQFRHIPVANISDSMSRLVAGGSKIRPMHRKGGICGSAITIKTCPGDNLMVHMALNIAREGDVIVIDAGGDLTNAIIGERMLTYCVAKKFSGIVLNGAVRDSHWIRHQDFPVYAAGVTHRGPYKNGPGEVNTTISLDGMIINPGDLIVGDEDGVISIPRKEIETVYKKAELKNKQEADSFSKIGKSDNNESGYRKKLESLGCYFE